MDSLKPAIILFVVVMILFHSEFAFAQQPRLSTFQETAQVIIDQRFLNQTSVSVTVLSTSTQEILVPVELEQKIRDIKSVIAVVITNEDQCVLGVVDSACVLINISRDEFEGGITEAQNKGRVIGDVLIEDINKAFGLDAQFHSTFIHIDDKINRELETSGIISGKGVVSVVYTMPKSDTLYFYEELYTRLLPKVIRDLGGFLDAAKKIAENPESSVTFSIIPHEGTSLFQLQVSLDQPLTDKMTNISPLDLLGVDKMKRSDYFKAGFFPLNSLVQVVVLSDEPMTVTGHTNNIVPTIERDGEKYPSELTKNGWLFDPEAGDRIVAKYLFGETYEVSKNNLKFTIGTGNEPQPKTTNDNSVYILVGIGATAAVAIFWYVRNPRKKV